MFFSVFCAGIKCPVCAKFVLPDDVECHLVMCLTKPRLTYNGELNIVFTQVLIIIISCHLHGILCTVCVYNRYKRSCSFNYFSPTKILSQNLMLHTHVGVLNDHEELFVMITCVERKASLDDITQIPIRILQSAFHSKHTTIYEWV